MKRQAIDGGGWFDREAATKFQESTHWNGSNHISNATGSQWNHEALYCTRRGVYVLTSWDCPARVCRDAHRRGRSNTGRRAHPALVVSVNG